MGKKTRPSWRYLAYFTVVISLGLLFAVTRNLLFLVWGVLMVISTTSILVVNLLRPTQKSMREKVGTEIYLLTVISLFCLVEVTRSDLFPWLIAAFLFSVLLVSFLLHFVKRRRGKAREEGQPASR